MMTRPPMHLAGALLAAVLVGGAGAPNLNVAVAEPGTPLVATAPAPAPGRAAPAAGGFTAFGPAPVPDQDLDGYRLKQAPAKVELSPSLFHERLSTVGDGYTPNSTVDSEQTKRLRPMPGLNLNVPLP